MRGSVAEKLGSVALRYRQPLGRQGWPSTLHQNTGARALMLHSEGDYYPTSEGQTVRSPPLARLEGVLLLAREPMGSRKLAQLAGLADGTEARTLIRTLNRLYDEEGCAFRVVEVAGGLQLRSRAKFAPWLRRLCAAEGEVRLSAPAMETLAVVAYRQPVLRADIEAIRGVQCGEVLRQLMERDLVRIVGRSEELGRPLLYGTSRHFLEVFGLRHLEELPRLNQPIHSSKTEGDSNVKIAADTKVVLEDGLAETSAALLEKRLAPRGCPVAVKDDEDDEDLGASEDEDEDVEDEDDDFEDDDWEEVEDDDDEAEDLEEEEEEPEEEEEEEDDEDEDWEDEDWEDDDDEDWEEEEEEEEDWE